MLRPTSSIENSTGPEESKMPWGGTQNSTSLFAPQAQVGRGGGLERFLACGAGLAAMCALTATICALAATAWVDTWEPLWLSSPQDLSPFVATGYTGFAAGNNPERTNPKSKSSTPLGFASSDTTLSSDQVPPNDDFSSSSSSSTANEAKRTTGGNVSADSARGKEESWMDWFLSRNSSAPPPPFSSRRLVSNVSDIVSYRYAISGKTAELEPTDDLAAFVANKRVNGRNPVEIRRKNLTTTGTAQDPAAGSEAHQDPLRPTSTFDAPSHSLDDEDEDMTDYRYIYLDDDTGAEQSEANADHSSQFQFQRMQASPEDWPRARRSYVTVFFKTGLWRTCPLYLHGNLQPNFVLPGLPCTSLGYFSWNPLTSDTLQLGGPIEFTPEFLNKLRYATPFLLLGAIIALTSIVVAFATPCCRVDRALLCSSLHILSGLSLGCGLIIFVSVLHGEFHEPLLAATRYRTASNTWNPPTHSSSPAFSPNGPSFRYGWAFYAAVAAFLNAELAAALYIVLHARTFGSQLRKLGIVQRRLLINARDYDYELLPFDTSFDTPLHSAKRSPLRTKHTVGGGDGTIGRARRGTQVLQPDQLTSCSQSSRLTLIQESIPESTSVSASNTMALHDTYMRKPPSLHSFGTGRGDPQQLRSPSVSEHPLGNYDPDILPFATPLPKPPSDFRDQSPGSPSAGTGTGASTHTTVQIEVTAKEAEETSAPSTVEDRYNFYTLKPIKSGASAGHHHHKDPCTCHLQYRSLPRHHHHQQHLTAKPPSQHVINTWMDSKTGLEAESDSSSASTSFMSNNGRTNHSQVPRRKSVSINRFAIVEVFDTQTQS